MKKGKLILIAGLPGSGKSTLIRYVREHFPEIVFPVSWTTRPQRPGEVDGEVYHFVDTQTFLKAVEADEFLEWVSIDGGHLYGTLKSEVVPALEAGKMVLREVEMHGAQRLREALPQADIVTIFTNTDSWEDLSKRILSHGPMGAEELAERKKRYDREMLFKPEANYVLENQFGKLEESEWKLGEIIQGLQK